LVLRKNLHFSIHFNFFDVFKNSEEYSILNSQKYQLDSVSHQKNLVAENQIIISITYRVGTFLMLFNIILLAVLIS